MCVNVCVCVCVCVCNRFSGEYDARAEAVGRGRSIDIADRPVGALVVPRSSSLMA